MQNITLSNKYLKVDIVIPDETYTRSRFDRMGMITNVVLNGKHSFGGIESEVEGEGSGGCGFYNEFGIEEAIGYEDTPVGDKFLKVGVGLLTKDNEEAYDFFRDYEVEALNYEVNEGSKHVTIKATSKEVNGISVCYTKRITLENDQMNVHYTLENLGSKKIETTEYCHNFVAINEHRIGPEYDVKFSFPVEVYDVTGKLKVVDDTITWDEAVDKVIYTRFNNVPNRIGNSVEILHKPSGVGVRETVDFKLHKVAMWGMPHVISPELFKKIELDVNEEQSWNRRYTFFEN